MNFLIIAPPNGGKGTLWYEISKKFPQLRSYVCSDHIKELMSGGHPDGEIMRSYITAGSLVPDEIINRIVFDKLKNFSEPRWQDGFPRTIPQAKAYEDEMGLEDLVCIYVRISDEECVERSENRRTCIRCGETQRVTADGSCEYKCTDEPNVQVKRSDDIHIVRRLGQYRRDTEPVVEYYIEKGVVVLTVNGDLGTAHILPQVERFVAGYLDSRTNDGIH